MTWAWNDKESCEQSSVKPSRPQQWWICLSLHITAHDRHGATSLSVRLAAESLLEASDPFSTMNLSTANHHIPLNDGNSIPIIGLGTYSDPRPVPGKTFIAVKTAIDEGYRHIDGAYVYRNEHEVGEAIREKVAEGKVKREEIFYCGKLWSTDHDPEMVRPALERTLQTLKLDYIDLYIIEMPMAFKPGEEFYPKDENGRVIYHKSNLCATWEALEACKDAGLVKSLGVSNFNRRQLEVILNKPGLKYKPVTNQGLELRSQDLLGGMRLYPPCPLSSA